MIQARVATRTLPANRSSKKGPHCGLFQPANDGGSFREIILCEGLLLRRLIPRPRRSGRRLLPYQFGAGSRSWRYLLAAFDCGLISRGDANARAVSEKPSTPRPPRLNQSQMPPFSSDLEAGRAAPSERSGPFLFARSALTRSERPVHSSTARRAAIARTNRSRSTRRGSRRKTPPQSGTPPRGNPSGVPAAVASRLTPDQLAGLS
jgi:hypothetical protein